MLEFIMSLLVWVCLQMGVDSATVEKPQVKFVSPEQMVVFWCKKPVICEEFQPVAYDGETFHIVQFGSDKDTLEVYSRHRDITGYVIHALVHHVQFVKYANKDPKVMEETLAFEQQALEIQAKYMSMISIGL
jgi:hypothetical protein